MATHNLAVTESQSLGKVFCINSAKLFETLGSINKDCNLFLSPAALMASIALLRGHVRIATETLLRGMEA